MSFFCSIEKSTSGFLALKLAHRPLLTFLYLREAPRSQRGNVRRAPSERSLDHHTARATELDAWFISSLVNASQCKAHTPNRGLATTFKSILRPEPRRMKQDPCVHFISRRCFHSNLSKEATALQNTTKEELLALVDQYNDRSFTDQLPLLELPNLRRPAPDPDLIISDKPEDTEWPPRNYVWPAHGEEKAAVTRLEQALEDFSHDTEGIYELYKALPAPRIPYLGAKVRHKLLHHLGVVERKDERSMLRYLSVIDDMKANNIPLTKHQWNSAISFAGRYVSRTTEVEVEAALHLWREMEHLNMVKGCNVTFNILFDLATKAGKFKLAEMIYLEMRNRGLEFNRFHYVSLIHHCGLRRDGIGARKAYEELVEAGEIVDTVVLNCIISALFSAGEPHAAEQVYSRMKSMHAARENAVLPPKDYKKRREVNRALLRLSTIGKKKPKLLDTYRKKSIIAPDLQTYRILLRYFAVTAGELHKATMFLDEMRWFGVDLHGSIFLALFKGFATHGGVRYSHWTVDRLDSVWNAFIKAVDREVEDLYIGKWLVIWILRAFSRCSGQARTIDVWEEIKARWKPDEADLDFVTGRLRSLLDVVAEDYYK